MADWRTTVIVSIIIPVGAALRLYLSPGDGNECKPRSMGAIDFGIIIDGAVVMVEGLFVALDRKSA